ncbi:hypothetical protein [Vibrio phage vB_VhaS-a]|nr:hypothetical protein [Vibrio phage vB_VhaS-a]
MVTIKGLSLKLAVDQLTALSNILNTVSEPNLINQQASRVISDAVTLVKTHDAEAMETLPMLTGLIHTLNGLVVSSQAGFNINEVREVNRLILETSQRLTFVITKDYNPNAN